MSHNTVNIFQFNSSLEYHCEVLYKSKVIQWLSFSKSVNYINQIGRV